MKQLAKLLPFCNEQICKQKREEFDSILFENIRSTVNSHSLLRAVATKSSETKFKVKEGLPVFLLPNTERKPMNFTDVGDDIIFIPTFRIPLCWDWNVKYLDPPRVDIVERCTRAASRSAIDMEEECLFKLLAPAATSDIPCVGVGEPLPAPVYQVEPTSKGSGFLSTELIEKMFIGMQERGQTMTHVLVSPEDIADRREWEDQDQGDATRREIFISGKSMSYTFEYEGEEYEIKFLNVHQLGMTGEYNINSDDSESGLFKVNGSGGFNDYSPTNLNKVDKDNNLVTAGETQVYGLDLTDKSESENIVFTVASPLCFFSDPKALANGFHGYYGWEEVAVAILNPKSICMGVIDRS